MIRLRGEDVPECLRYVDMDSNAHLALAQQKVDERQLLKTPKSSISSAAVRSLLAAWYK